MGTDTRMSVGGVWKQRAQSDSAQRTRTLVSDSSSTLFSFQNSLERRVFPSLPTSLWFFQEARVNRIEAVI